MSWPQGKITAFTREAAWQAKQMYEERDATTGRRRYTIQQIADHFCVGESTAYRAIKGIGPYMNLPEVKAPEVLDAEANAALERLLASDLVKGPQTTPTPPAPVTKIESSIKAEMVESATDRMIKMAQKIREKQGAGNTLIDELKGGTNGTDSTSE